MDNSKFLDVYSIQGKAEEILYALDHVTDDDEVILYTGLESVFTMGEHIVPKTFSNAIFVKIKKPYLLNNGIERHGKLIKIMDGSVFSEDLLVSQNLAFLKNDELTLQNIESILHEKSISYNKIKSDGVQSIEHKKDTSTPEIWFGRDIDIFFDALEGETNKDANIYSNINGHFSLSLTRGTQKETLYQRDYPYALEIGNKLLLIPSSTKQEERLHNMDNSFIIRGGGMQSSRNLGYYPIGPKVDFISQQLLQRGFNVNKYDELPSFVISKYKMK